MDTLNITPSLELPLSEIEINAIRAQGAGGQNVNKVSSAIHLRFDINASTLPDNYKQGLFSKADQRINKQGVLVIKAQQFRTREANLQDALQRLQDLILSAGQVARKRIATKPSRRSKQKRLDSKTQHGRTKALRGRVV